MLFTKTQRYHANVPKEELINKLSGTHVKIHNLDFEILKNGKSLRIVPHAEEVEDIKTLPITSVDMKDKDVVVTSRMRRLDLGGPLLIVAFCCFLLLAAAVSLYIDRNRLIPYTLIGLCTFIFSVFYVRMQMGYYDYVRKIRAFIKSNIDYAEMAEG